MKVALKGWIVLNVLVHTEETEQLEELSLEIPETMNTYKPYLIQISSIHGIPIDKINEPSLIYIGPHIIDVKETPEEIIALIGIDSVKPLIDFKNN